MRGNRSRGEGKHLGEVDDHIVRHRQLELVHVQIPRGQPRRHSSVKVECYPHPSVFKKRMCIAIALVCHPVADRTVDDRPPTPRAI